MACGDSASLISRIIAIRPIVGLRSGTTAKLKPTIVANVRIGSKADIRLIGLLSRRRRRAGLRRLTTSSVNPACFQASLASSRLRSRPMVSCSTDLRFGSKAEIDQLLECIRRPAVEARISKSENNLVVSLLSSTRLPLPGKRNALLPFQAPKH